MADGIKIKQFQGQDGILVTDVDGDGEVSKGDRFEKLTVDHGVKGVKEHVEGQPPDETRPATEAEVQQALDNFRNAQRKIDALASGVSALTKALAEPRWDEDEEPAVPGKRDFEGKAAELDAVAGTLDKPGSLSPYLRSRANVTRSIIHGKLADLTSIFSLGTIRRHGKIAYQALMKASADDPNNSDTWFRRGMVLLNLNGKIYRGKIVAFFREQLQIDLGQELVEIMQALNDYPDQTRPQIMLDMMLSNLVKDANVDVPAELASMQHAIHQRTERLRRENPEKTAEVDAYLAELRADIG